MKNIQFNTPDIFLFEKKFREIIYEVQRNIKELDSLEKERLLISEELCSKNSLLQNERKISNELRIRLKSALEAINRLEEEKMRDKINYSNLSINYENVLKECEILTKETLFSQTKTAKFQLKIESLEYILKREIQQKEKLEQTLIELKNNSEKIITNINM
ncbi:uncharacterized protein LOC133666649 [Apis cerana]|nr:uncharacterized protein LOC133666649 [Apis cerana]